MRENTLYKYCDDPYWHDLEHWPTPGTLSLSEAVAVKFEKRSRAIRLWHSGQTLERVYQSTGIVRDELYRHLERALTYRSETEIWGFAALIPGTHVKAYKKTTPPGIGYAGNWSRFIELYPELDEFIQTEYLEKRKPGHIPVKGVDVADIHERLIIEAEEEGLTPEDYPFSNADRGYTAVLNYCHSLENGLNARQAVHARGGQDLAKKYDATTPQSGKALNFPLAPYEQVEFDEHEIGLFMTIQQWTPEGIYKPLTLTKCWILLIIDVVSRAILGYHLSLSKKYTKQDVLRCFVHALTPWKPLEHTFSFETYHPDGGFPSGVIENCRWRLFDEVALDNCKTHISKQTLERLVHVCETIPSMDGKGLPTKRPFIESFNKSFKRAFSDKLPSTTGSNHFDFRRRGPECAAEKYDIRLDEIRVLIDVVLANYNGSKKHSGLKGSSPLDTIRQHDSQLSTIPRTLHPEFREKNPLNCIRIWVTVRGGRKRGEHPYVRFMYENYKSAELSTREDLARPHTKIQFEIDWFQPQEAKLFDPAGKPICTVRAQGEWGRVQHTLDDRTAVAKLLNSGKMFVDPNKGLMGSYRSYLSQKGLNDKKMRKRLAQVSSNALGAMNDPDLMRSYEPPEYEVDDEYDDDDFDFSYLSED